MLSSPLKKPLSFFGARTTRTAPRVHLLNNALCGTVRIVRVPHELGGFKGDLLAFPLDRFLGIVLLRLKRMIRPATAVAILK